MRKYLLLLAAAALLAAPRPAHAFSLTVSGATVTNHDVVAPIGSAQPGDFFTITGAPLTYASTAPGEPATLTGLTLDITGYVDQVNGTDVHYGAGTGPGAAVMQGGASVLGTTGLDLFAKYGPTGDAFIYGFISPGTETGVLPGAGTGALYLEGTYMPNPGGATGTFSGTITRPIPGTAIPEPGTLALLGSGLLPLLGLRRRK